MVKRVLAIILATIISFTAVETTGLFFVSANNVINSYENSNADIQDKKDAEYYFTVYTSDGTGTNDDNLDASELTYFKQVMTGLGEDNDGKLYQYAFVMANGKKVTATDVTDEDGKWVATKLECADGSYVKTNYDAIHLFGGSHNSDTPIPKTDVTLSGTTHVQSVWGGGFHKSQVTEANVTVEGETRVAGIQGGAAACFAGTSCKAAGDECTGLSSSSNLSQPCFKPSDGNTDKEKYDKDGNARVGTATVNITGYAGKYTPPTTGVEKDTLVYGGGESVAYTGKCTLNISGGDLSDAFVAAAGSNGYTEDATVNVSVDAHVGTLASGKSGIVGDAHINVLGGTVDELVVGSTTTDTNGFAKVSGTDVDVTGGTVENVKFGNNGAKAINPDSDEGFTVKANGGTIKNFDGEDVGYDSNNVSCNHAAYINKEGVKLTSAVAATCQVDGSYGYWQCSNCMHYFADVDADEKYDAEKDKDVTGEDGNINKESTIEQNGIKIKANEDAHDYNGDIVVTVDCTCLTAGMKSYTVCTVCHNQKAIVTDENGEYIKEVAADKSKYQYTDTIGEAKITDKDLVIEELGHEYSDNNQIFGCDGKTLKFTYAVCKRCKTYFEVTGPEPPYTYRELTKDSDDKNNDGKFNEKDLATYGDHKTLTEREGYRATCSATGERAYVVCEDCDNVISIDGVALETPAKYDEVKYQIIIPATGHDWDWTLQITKEPTCIAGGEGEITCKRCDKKEIVIIDKNPSAHKYKNDGICQLCGQKDPGYVVVTQSGSNVTSKKETNKNNKKNAKIVKIINSRNKTKVKVKKKKIIIKFSRRGGCKYRIKIYNKKNKEISLKVKQDYMKGNGKKKFKKFYQIKKKGDYRIEIYELKGMKEKNFKDVKCIYLNYKTIK